MKRPACNAVADRRMLNLRPSCVSYAAGMKNRSERKTCLQQAGRTPTRVLRTKRKTHSVPGVQRKKRSTPTAERVQREKRSTPTAGRVSNGRRAYHSNRRTCPEGEGLITPTRWTRPRTKGLSLRPSARAACEGLNHFALAAFPRGRPCGTTRAEGLTPRFLGRETLEKPDNDLSITPHRRVGKGFGASQPKVFDPVQFSSEKPQQKFGKRRPDPERGYFRHRPRVRIRRTHRSSFRFARALRVS